MINYYKQVLSKYAVFSGRATRAEYWWFYLANIIIYAVLYALGYVADAFLIIYYIYALAVFVPGLAVTWRRLHDTNHSGWWVLISLIPLIGTIISLVFLVTDSQPSDNKYGPNPKNTASPAPVQNA